MIQSVQRAFAILEALEEAGAAGLALGDLAGRVGLKGPTTYQLVQTLVTLGYARQLPGNRHYALGQAAGRLGRRQFEMERLVTAAQTVVPELVRELNETAIVAVYRERQRHTVLSVESDQDLRVSVQTGADTSFYTTATGRLLLAHLPQADRDRLVADLGLPTADQWPGMQTIAAVSAAARQIRAAGHAAYRPLDQQIAALAVPLTLADSALPAALGIYYPAMRRDATQTPALLDILNQAATRLAVAFEVVTP